MFKFKIFDDCGYLELNTRWFRLSFYTANQLYIKGKFTGKYSIYPGYSSVKLLNKNTNQETTWNVENLFGKPWLREYKTY